MSEWQPIETAPQEKYRHFLLFGDGEAIRSCAFVGMRDDAGWRLAYERTRVKPTHWMLLPGSPK